MSEGLSPPRKRARLRADEETATTPIVVMPDEPDHRGRLDMSSFLQLARGRLDAQEVIDSTSVEALSAAVGALEALSSVVSVEEPMPMAVAVAAEESTTDDEELQQLSMTKIDTIVGTNDSSLALELVYDDVVTFLFNMAREQKTQQLRKGMRTVRKARNADELLPRLLTAEDETGLTLLMIGVRGNDCVFCNMLLDAGADVNFKTEKRTYALLLAAQKGWEDMTKFLLAHGANEESKNMALIPAAHFGHLPVVIVLLETGANQNYANKKGTTPLMRAAQEGRDAVVKFLIQKGADTCAANNEGMTALMLAAQRGHASIATLLIKSGSNVNKQTRQGSTALLLAAKRGHTAAVEALMTAGADIFLKDDRDKTAAETAQRRGHVDLFLKISVQNQLRLMREDLRRQRCYMLMRLSTLYMSMRARLTPAVQNKKRFQYNCLMDRTLRLPKPLLQNVALFLPLSRMWDHQLRYLIYKAAPQPNRVVQQGIRIIDEILLSVCLEQRPSLHTIKLKCGGPLHVIGQLGLLRDSCEYRSLLTTECRTPMSPRMLYQLRRMADIQGALSTYAAGSAIQFGVEVAQDVVARLTDLLSWDAVRRQADLVE
ncbi:Integral membrane ankyrin-repeat protein Kidins220 (protein kinase D substrate) [Plasmopara halstedii]|uniref:Integral membrane ankyrin-repeat protein Kidins220 (Protein kinase D substrate) n=1 Tax=Plasmopara halstedii TaxID=4781 RepID=A0A0P1A4Y2_PLAHL|nr:Integral membrane ankyrin-repeat protein Kidins220 (protein kinase D substrate) [Plasmopara halstedii]CEG35556.1 Integral membrane ankyrin-repeat protein Kidins220 (protein kinase D substrate) [Plasmopara halstedii]|eukprot:XP_024571925.1 Integral membrane ankyrin-repeat protein Kidins220 (protein kinase D substrate) [Plasmopara halstedii]